MLDAAEIATLGTDLRRPECVLAQHLLAPRTGGGPFASEPFVAGEIPDGTGDVSLPNGLAFDATGNFLIANCGTKRIEALTRHGHYRVVLDHLDGKSLGQTNFVLRDRHDRIWLTVTTRQDPW